MNRKPENPTQIFLDIQGYYCSFGYIPKELAIYDGVRCSNFLFKSPFRRNTLSPADLKVVNWAEQYHGLDWESGNIDLNEIEDIVRNIHKSLKNPKIYVKGNEKKKFLSRIVNEEFIFMIPNECEPKLSKFKKIPECYFHKDIQPWHCALANVKLLFNYKHCYNK